MGNQLSGTVPSMIIPVERYFSLPELGDFEFLGNLGSTRFLKVAKAMHKSISSNMHPSRSSAHPGKSENLSAVEIFQEGVCLLKVFVINDQSLPLGHYLSQIEELQNKLLQVSSMNCLPFKKTVLTDKAAVLIRQYVKDTLYDRLSTRPFLKDIEKRWIAFQLLKALEQCQSAKVCHGDIKSQNVLVTSWNWVFLADFASFKPTVLPADNPADYSYFFDTGRRRTCYIAPERFVRTSDLANFTLLPGEQAEFGCKLEDSMDVFSLGCVFVELFTDGLSPFDFSQLLAYIEKRYYPSKSLDGIKDSKLREMITGMIQLDPTKRSTADQYLIRYRNSVFPDQFYTFLYPYMKQFVELPRLSHDEKVDKLHDYIAIILEQLKCDAENSTFYVIFVSFVTSLIRCFVYTDSKLKALGLLKLLSTYCKEDVILDRILPYMLYTCRDTDPRIRAESIHCISQIVSQVREVPKSDVRVFVDYIFPVLGSLTMDSCSIVRVAVAEEMALLADNAARFLEYVALNSEADPQVQADSYSHADLTYQTELKSLQEVVQEMVVTLLCDKDNTVRRTLVHSGLPRLCLFFGRQKASDVLMSHLITFLNDKSDWRLRASFYDCIPALAAYVGWQCTSLLKPLLVQGLRDPEEQVVFKSLSALTNLCRLGLLQKPTIIELFNDVLPFLAHPNLYLRIGTACFVSSCAKALNIADVHCKLMPALMRYMKKPLMKLDREVLLLHSLSAPLPRTVWQNAKTSPLISDLISFLHEKSLLQQLGAPQSASLSTNLSRNNQQPVALPEDTTLSHFYQRLCACGLNENNEFKLRNFGEILCKLRRLRSAPSSVLNLTRENGLNDAVLISNAEQSSPSTNSSSPASKRLAIANPGALDLSRTKVRRKHADLTVDRVGKRIFGSKLRPSQAVNPDWKEMFCADGKTDKDAKGPDSSPTENSSGKNSDNFDQSLAVKITDKDEQNLLTETIVEATGSQASTSLLSDETIVYPEGSSEGPIDTSIAAETNIRMARCRSDLTALVELKRDEWRVAAKWAGSDVPVSLFFAEKIITNGDVRLEPVAWHPKGQLIGHLHEHKGSIRRLSPHPTGRYFLSCGQDGSVKCWDIAKFEGCSMVNKSKFTYVKCGGKLTSVSCLTDCFACSSDNGRLQVVKFNSGSSKPRPVYQVQIDQGNDDYLIDTCAFNDAGRISVVGLSHHGRVACWDTREAPGEPAWHFANPSPLGLVTCMALDPRRRHWVALGTDAGRLALWDVRFRLLISQCSHPASMPFCRLQPHPSDQTRVWSSTFRCSEAIEWNLETGSRQSVVWMMHAPPLSYKWQNSSEEQMQVPSTVTAMLPYPNFDDFANSVLISGDSLGNILSWNLNSISSSYVISSACDLPPILDGSTCRSQVIDGVNVHFQQKPDRAKIDALTYHGAAEFASIRCPGHLSVTSGHIDAITDLIACRTSSQNLLLISSSRDGVIKAWR